LSVDGRLELWHVMVLAAMFGAGTAFFGPAFDAIVPDLVPTEQLTQANSLDQFVRPAAYRMLGPAMGGWIIASTGAGMAFLVNGATFVVSILCVLVMRERTASEASDALEASPIQQMKEGFRFVRRHTWLWGTLLAATVAYLMFMGPTEVLLPLAVKDLHGTARDLGFILALGGVGSMLSAFAIGHHDLPRRHITFMYVAWTMSTLSLAGYGLARDSWQLMVACFAFNTLESAGTIVWTTTKQRLVPGRLLGRVSSFDWFISTGLVPVSMALTPLAAAAFGVRATLVGAGVLGAVATLVFLFLPGMRDPERREVVDDRRLAAASPVAQRVGP
jgi:MFS family permease